MMIRDGRMIGHGGLDLGPAPQRNTDRVVWDGVPEGQDAKVVITEGGAIGIEAGGRVRVLTAERWLRYAQACDGMLSLLERL